MPSNADFFDMNHKQIKNLSNGTDNLDAVNYGQLTAFENNLPILMITQRLKISRV